MQCNPQIQSIEPIVINRTSPQAFTSSGGSHFYANEDQSEIQQQLYNAVKSNDIKIVRFLLGVQHDESFDSKGSGFDLSRITDNKGNTLLHHAAANSSFSIFQDVLIYQRKQAGQDNIIDWIGAYNKIGCQCLHIACHRGNLQIVELIFKLGCNMKSKNLQGQSCLHIVAQSDQTQIMVYLTKIAKLDIDAIDNLQSTPLHQAAYNGAESCAFLLLAWGCQVNLTDQQGFTPLHLAAISGQSRILRRLLVYNADTTIRDKEQLLAKQLAMKNNFDNLADNIQEYETCCSIKRICGVSNRARANQKQRLQLCLLIIGILLNLSYQLLFTLQYSYYGYVQSGLWGVFLLQLLYICNSNPGYLPIYKQHQEVMLGLLNTYNAQRLCCECESFKPNRSKHCDFCQRCVSVYDHHCPWINNCIGANNHLCFMIFLITLWALMTTSLASILLINWNITPIFDTYSLMIDIHLYTDIMVPYMDTIKLYVGIGIATIILMFYFLLIGLIWFQCVNVFSNITTYEKLTQKDYRQSQVQITGSDASEILLSKEKKKGGCINMGDMLCNNKHNEQYQFEYKIDISVTTGV